MRRIECSNALHYTEFIINKYLKSDVLLNELRNNIGSVIIVTRNEDRIPAGIITERDIVRIVGKLNPDLLNTPLKSLMSRPLITIEESASMTDASKLMNTKKIRRLVVVDSNNKMSGILTQNDIFRAIDKNPNLFSEFYGENFSSKFKEIYEKFNQYRLENLMPEFHQYRLEG